MRPADENSLQAPILRDIALGGGVL